MLKKNDPNLSTLSRRTSANRLMVFVAEIGTVLTKVMNDKPRPRENWIMDVLGRKALALTLTCGTYTHGLVG